MERINELEVRNMECWPAEALREFEAILTLYKAYSEITGEPVALEDISKVSIILQKMRDKKTDFTELEKLVDWETYERSFGLNALNADKILLPELWKHAPKTKSITDVFFEKPGSPAKEDEPEIRVRIIWSESSTSSQYVVKSALPDAKSVSGEGYTVMVEESRKTSPASLSLKNRDELASDDYKEVIANVKAKLGLEILEKGDVKRKSFIFKDKQGKEYKIDVDYLNDFGGNVELETHTKEKEGDDVTRALAEALPKKYSGLIEQSGVNFQSKPTDIIYRLMEKRKVEVLEADEKAMSSAKIIHLSSSVLSASDKGADAILSKDGSVELKDKDTNAKLRPFALNETADAIENLYRAGQRVIILCDGFEPAKMHLLKAEDESGNETLVYCDGKRRSTMPLEESFERQSELLLIPELYDIGLGSKMISKLQEKLLDKGVPAVCFNPQMVVKTSAGKAAGKGKSPDVFSDEDYSHMVDASRKGYVVLVRTDGTRKRRIINGEERIVSEQITPPMTFLYLNKRFNFNDRLLLLSEPFSLSLLQDNIQYVNPKLRVVGVQGDSSAGNISETLLYMNHEKSSFFEMDISKRSRGEVAFDHDELYNEAKTQYRLNGISVSSAPELYRAFTATEESPEKDMVRAMAKKHLNNGWFYRWLSDNYSKGAVEEWLYMAGRELVSVTVPGQRTLPSYTDGEDQRKDGELSQKSE